MGTLQGRSRRWCVEHGRKVSLTPIDHHDADRRGLGQGLEGAGEFVATFQSTLPVCAHITQGPGGRGGYGVGVAADISENHTISYTLDTTNSQTLWQNDVDSSACPIHTTG